MKIAHFCTFDDRGGAAREAYRLHADLVARGIDSEFWTAFKTRSEPEVHQMMWARRWQRRRGLLGKKIDPWIIRECDRAGSDIVSSGFFGFDIGTTVGRRRADIVQLHWLGYNSFRISSLAGIDAPVVWKLSDMWPFCGVEHYTEENRFAEGYDRSNRPDWLRGLDVSRLAWENKRRAYAAIPSLTIVAPSQWIADCARRSVLFRDREVVVVGTGCDTRLFRAKDQAVCRDVLGLPQDKKIILAGAESLAVRRKGGDLLAEALNILHRKLPPQSFEVVLFGEGARGLKLDMPTRALGRIDELGLLASLYSAADVFVAPSRQENLANTVLEAMACGTPCAAFDIGGMPDLIEPGRTGRLARPFDPVDLAHAIGQVLAEAGPEHRAAAREKIERHYSLETQGDGMTALYSRLLGTAPWPDPRPRAVSGKDRTEARRGPDTGPAPSRPGNPGTESNVPLAPPVKRALGGIGLRLLRKGWRKGRRWAQGLDYWMRLGVLYQYPPRPLAFSTPVPRLPRRVPSFALVTPSYNQAAYLEQTIQSVLDQGYPRMEYAVIDGASTDGSPALVERYRHRLTYAVSERDGGQTQALAKGFGKVRGDLMGWLNSDDMLLPGSLAAVAEFFDHHPEIDVVYGERILIDRDGSEVGRWLLPPHNAERFRLVDTIPQETCFWRRSVWERVGGIDTSFSFAMDWDLFLRFQAAGARFHRLPRFLGCFRVHEEQKTSTTYDTVGRAEIERLQIREHGRVISKEVEKQAVAEIQWRALWRTRLWEWRGRP